MLVYQRVIHWSQLMTLELLPGQEPYDFDADGGHQGLRAGEAIEFPGRWRPCRAKASKAKTPNRWLDPKVVDF